MLRTKKQSDADGRTQRAFEDDARERLLAEVPVAERRLRLAGVSTAILECGDGPPLVLLHGGIECGGVYWARVISRLASFHHVIVPDVPGLGESEPVARLDAATFAGWFGELLRSTCNEKPILVAHSLVGSLVARYAREHGDLLRRLMIYGAPGVGPYRMPAGLAVAAIRFSLRPSQRNHERFERWAFLDPDRTKQLDPSWFEAFDAYSVSRGRVRHVKRAMQQLVAVGRKQVPEAELRSIGVPTVLVWGRHDRMAPLALAETASRRHNWPLHVIDDCGHVPHLEQPEAFLEVLCRELSSP